MLYGMELKFRFAQFMTLCKKLHSHSAGHTHSAVRFCSAATQKYACESTVNTSNPLIWPDDGSDLGRLGGIANDNVLCLLLVTPQTLKIAIRMRMSLTTLLRFKGQNDVERCLVSWYSVKIVLHRIKIDILIWYKTEPWSFRIGPHVISARLFFFSLTWPPPPWPPLQASAALRTSTHLRAASLCSVPSCLVPKDAAACWAPICLSTSSERNKHK